MPAFRLLRGLQEFNFTGSGFNLNYATHEIAQVIGNSPKLEKLELRAERGSVNLRPEGIFAKLDHSTNLRRVGFADCFTSLPSMLLPHIRSLESFHWVPFHKPFASGPSPWPLFMQENITLSELVTSEVCQDLRRYLGSFEGLRKLEIIPRGQQYSGFSTFCIPALPMHAHSLEVLGVVVGLEISERNLVNYSIRNLKTLTTFWHVRKSRN
jgi:hypothetical protein